MATSLSTASVETPVVWQPHPGSQTLFLTCPFDECFFHGPRGPGKTDALIMDFGQEIDAGYGASWRGILFRKTYKQLADVVAKTQKWFPRIWPHAKFNESDYRWTWPDGEALYLRYMDTIKDYWNYHGHEYPWIGWEELTNWAKDECYEAMKSCNRSTQPNMPRRIRSTGNPWGAGHHWVKKYFIDASAMGAPKTEVYANPLTGNSIERTRTHVFGSFLENKVLMQTDPEYVARLISIKDKNLKKAWFGGSWDIVAGGFFLDVWDPVKNVIARPWTPPKNWKCFTSFDWGSASPFSLGFWTKSNGEMAPDGKHYPRGAYIRFDEWYGAKPDEDNVGLKLRNEDIGKGIKARIEAYENAGLKINPGVADPSIWDEQGGTPIVQQIFAGAKRILWSKADNKRVPGWQTVRDAMKGSEDRGPELLVMANCRNWLRTVPMIKRDDKNWDDVDTDVEDHAADETRYAIHTDAKETKVVQIGGY